MSSLKKSFLLYSAFCFFNAHPMELGVVAICAKAAPIIATVGTKGIMLLGGASLVAASSNTTKKETKVVNECVHLQDFLQNYPLLFEGKKEFSSVCAQSNENYRKRLERHYRFFIIFPGLNDNTVCRLPGPDKFNIPQELPESDKYDTFYHFPGSNKNSIPLQCPGIKTLKQYCFDAYGNTDHAITTIVSTNHTQNTYNNTHIDSSSHYRTDDPSHRKECYKAPVSSEFKEMQLRGEIRELEEKLTELEEKLSFVSALRILKKRELHKQIDEIKALLAEELTEIILTIKNSDLNTARFELESCMGNPYLYEIAQKIFDNRPENCSPTIYHTNESELHNIRLLEQINNTWSPLERIDLQQQIENINQSKEVNCNKIDQNIDQEQICIIDLSHGLQELNIDNLKAQKIELLEQINNTWSPLEKVKLYEQIDFIEELQVLISNSIIVNDQNIALNNEQIVANIDSFGIVSTIISQDNITIAPEANQRITETLDTLNDQSLEAVSSHIDTLVAMLQEQKCDTQANGKCFAEGLRLYALLRQYIENPNKRIVAQPDANVLIFNARKNALDIVAHNPTKCSEQSFTLTPEACDLLQTRGLDPKQFIYCIGNEVQHQLYSEFVMLLNAIAEIEPNASTQPLIDIVLTCTQAGQKYTEQNNIEKAFDTADLSWAWLDCAKAIWIQGIDLTKKTTIDIAKGIMHGLQSAVLKNVNMVLHPVDTMSNVANTFCHLAYCFGKFMEPIMIYDGETEIDAETITRVNEEWKENLQSVINETKGITVEGSVAFVTDFLVSPKITKAGIGLLSHYSKMPVAQLVKIVKEAKDNFDDKAPKFFSTIRKTLTDTLSHLVEEESIAVTTDGAKVSIPNKVEESNTFNAMGKNSNNHSRKNKVTPSVDQKKGIGKSNWQRMTAKEARTAAKKLGFEETNYFSENEPIFRKENLYITPDRKGHNGGIWKMSKSHDFKNREKRLGTYDKDLNRIGD